MNNKYVKWIALIVIIGVVIGNIWHFVENFRNRGFLRNRLDITENNNVKMLKQLDDKWSLPDDYSLEVKEVNGIKMEWIQAKGKKPDKAILQLHGGSYTRSLEESGTTYQRTAVQYAKISGAGVLTVDYRVAPENPYPAALEDAVLAYNWLLEQGYQPKQIIIVGDSAGGGLTLATALYLRDHDMLMPAALITMSAWTNLNYKRMVPDYVGDNRADNPYISLSMVSMTVFLPC